MHDASSTYLTGTLTNFMRAVATDPHLIATGGTGMVRLLSLLAGAIIGALILRFAPSWTPVFPVVLIAGTVVLAAALIRRGGNTERVLMRD